MQRFGFFRDRKRAQKNLTKIVTNDNISPEKHQENLKNVFSSLARDVFSPEIINSLKLSNKFFHEVLQEPFLSETQTTITEISRMIKNLEKVYDDFGYKIPSEFFALPALNDPVWRCLTSKKTRAMVAELFQINEGPRNNSEDIDLTEEINRRPGQPKYAKLIAQIDQYAQEANIPFTESLMFLFAAYQLGFDKTLKTDDEEIYKICFKQFAGLLVEPDPPEENTLILHPAGAAFVHECGNLHILDLKKQNAPYSKEIWFTGELLPDGTDYPQLAGMLSRIGQEQNLKIYDIVSTNYLKRDSRPRKKSFGSNTLRRLRSLSFTSTSRSFRMEKKT